MYRNIQKHRNIVREKRKKREKGKKGKGKKPSNLGVNNGKQFKIILIIAHQIGDRIFQIVECN